jgi:hypothetical protein
VCVTRLRTRDASGTHTHTDTQTHTHTHTARTSWKRRSSPGSFSIVFLNLSGLEQPRQRSWPRASAGLRIAEPSYMEPPCEHCHGVATRLTTHRHGVRWLAASRHLKTHQRGVRWRAATRCVAACAHDSNPTTRAHMLLACQHHRVWLPAAAMDQKRHTTTRRHGPETTH